MDTALPQKFPFILDRNLRPVGTSCDSVVLGYRLFDATSYLLWTSSVKLIH